MVSHPVLNLRQKEHWGTVLAGTKEEIAPTDSDDEAETDYEFVPFPEKVPSWASKPREDEETRLHGSPGSVQGSCG